MYIVGRCKIMIQATLLNEIKKLNQARRFNNSLNGQGKNEQLADANSSIIRTKLHELEKRKELV